MARGGLGSPLSLYLAAAGVGTIGIVDFDAAMGDPAHPGKLKVEYDSADHLHPNAAGYRRMGEIINLDLFNE